MYIKGNSLESVLDTIANNIYTNSKSVYYNEPNVKDLAWALSLVYYNDEAKDIEDKIKFLVTDLINSEKYRVEPERLRLFKEKLKEKDLTEITSDVEFVAFIIKSVQMNWGHIAYWPVNKENKDSFHDLIKTAIVDYVVTITEYSAASTIKLFNDTVNRLMDDYKQYLIDNNRD